MTLPGAELAPTLETSWQPRSWPDQAGSWGPVGITGHVCTQGRCLCHRLPVSPWSSPAPSLGLSPPLRSAPVSASEGRRCGGRKEPDSGAHLRLLSHLPQLWPTSLPQPFSVLPPRFPQQLTFTPWREPHFSARHTEARRGKGTCSRPTARKLPDPALELGSV